MAGQPKYEASSPTASSPKLLRTLSDQLPPYKHCVGCVLSPFIVGAEGILPALCSKGLSERPTPREQHNANYSSSVRLWDFHDCGRAKIQTSATAFSHNTRKLGGLPVERQGIKC